MFLFCVILQAENTSAGYVNAETDFIFDYDFEERIIGMLDFREKRENKIRKYKDEYVRTLIEEIIMYDDHSEVKFKSGIQTEVKIK